MTASTRKQIFTWRSRRKLIFIMIAIVMTVVAGLILYGFVKLARAGGGHSQNGDSGNIETFQQVPHDGNIESFGNASKCNGRMLMTWKDSRFVFIQCKAMEQLGPRFLPANTSIIETTSMPEHDYLYPEISNGHVATVVQSSSIFMNGLYNGANVSSHRAFIPSTAAIFVTVASPEHGMLTKYRLDLGRGVFSEVHTGDGFTVEVRRYAHRELTRLLVTEVVVSRATSTLPITLTFHINSTGPQSEDIDFVQEEPGLWSGRTKEAEYPEIKGTTPVTVIFSVIPPKLTFAPSAQGTVAFFTSVSVDREEALAYYEKGITYLGQGTLFSSHVSLWEALWQRGHIELMGNDTMAVTTTAALYYLYSALPLKEDTTWPFIGLSPNGLAHGGDGEDYWGHVFWDQDTWMFPPLALLHADLGRQIMDTRLQKLSAAQLYAKRSGLRGARYPWESGFTGLNTSPSEDTTKYELHVTGDAAWMMRQYLQLTHDLQILTHFSAYQALADIADFWVSRSAYNEAKGMYEINDVMGADEWNFPVNNSVHTNVVAIQSLRTAQYAANLTGQTPDPQWDTVASKMYIDYNSSLDYHPEYENYQRGRHVKQADTILLGFPLQWNMTRSVHENDLTYYAKVTPGGPAMTWGIFAINWLRLGHRDLADTAFHKGTLNVQEPFKVWSENADGTGAYNFHTGMGGYLQSLLYGYVGVDLNDDYLDFDPQLPPHVTGMAVRHMDYLGSSMDIVFDEEKMNVTLMSAGSRPLSLFLKSTAQTVDLVVGSTATANRQPARILPMS